MRRTSDRLPRPGDTKYRVLELIQQYNLERGKGPTVEELRVALGMKTRSGVQFHIDDLRHQGLVESLDRRARSSRTTERGRLLLDLMSGFEDADGSPEG